MTWVMTTKREPGGIVVNIGDIRIASIRFVPKNRAALWVDRGEALGTFACDNVSAAFHKLHELLNSPPPDGFDTSATYKKDRAQ